MTSLTGRRILLGVSGGIAAYKSVSLLRLLVEAGADVQVVMTPAATRFVGPPTFAALSGKPVHSDVFEQPDAVLHVRLARRAELAVVAPATANLLARLALGLADDLLSSTLLEASCPIVLAPAMHTGMWSHAATRSNVQLLRDRGAMIVGPDEGALAAGDTGIGRMAEPEVIFDAAGSMLAAGQDLSGVRMLVTAGPTHEPIDAVRYLGNRSSGKMGFAAETGELLPEGRRKLAEKNLDLVVVNEVGRPGTGFGADTDVAAILGRGGEDVPPRAWTKPELAAAICDRVASLIRSV